MSEVNFHYSYILDNFKYDTYNSINNTSLVSSKCFISFYKSIEYCIEHFPQSKHTVGIFYKSYENQELFDSIKKLLPEVNNPKIIFEHIDISEQGESGRLSAFKQSMHWLQSKGKQFVFNVQDDYLFHKPAIYEMYVVSNQVKFNTGYDILTSPFNKFKLWLAVHGTSHTPKTLDTEKYKWFQYYDLTNSFMTTHKQFSECWDVYNKFFSNDPEFVKNNFNSLNVMMHTRQNFGFTPVNNLAFHIKPEIEDSPDESWKTLWDSIDVTLPTT